MKLENEMALDAMANPTSGGCAFPHSVTFENHTVTGLGMSLRDYFAAKASDKDVEAAMYQGGFHMSRQAARYAHADLMLAERAK